MPQLKKSGGGGKEIFLCLMFSKYILPRAVYDDERNVH